MTPHGSRPGKRSARDILPKEPASAPTPTLTRSRAPQIRLATAALTLICMLITACHAPDKTLYDVAARGQRRDKAERLIRSGSDVNETHPGNQWTPLLAAAAGGHPKMCDVLIKAGANLNAQDANGNTPLHLARAGGHTKTASVLLAAGADPNIKNNQGKTPDELSP